MNVDLPLPSAIAPTGRAPARGLSVALLVRGLMVVLALAALAVGVGIARDLRQASRWGLTYEANTARLLFVERGSAAARGGLRPGDTITAIDLAPPGPAPAMLDGMLPVSVQRGDGLGMTMLTDPAHGLAWAEDVLLAVAAALWLSGVLVGLAVPRRPAARWFSLFALLGATALCCAAAQDPVVGWAQWLLGPAMFGAIGSYVFLQRALVASAGGRWSSLWLDAGACGLAALPVAALLILPRLAGAQVDPGLAALAGFEAPALVVAAHVLSFARLGREAPAPARRRVRLALLVGCVGWLPALALGWAPPLATLLGLGYIAPLSPYTGALSLIALALAYPAIVVRGDLFWLEVAVRRALVTGVVGGALLSLAFALWWGIDTVWHPAPGVQLALGAAVALVALPVFDPARRALQGGVDRRFDPGHFDYGPALQAIADALLPLPGQSAFDARAIAGVLVRETPALLGIRWVEVWLRDPGRQRWLHCDAYTPQGYPRELPAALLAAATGPFLLRGAAPAADRVAADHEALPGPGEDVLCLPVHLAADLRAVLLLGPRRSQDPYRQADRAALVLLARQVAAALQLADVLADLQARNAELAQLTGRLARAREEERKHLSRELHDAVAQDLVAITRQLRRHQQGALPEAIWQDLIAQAQEALTTTRRICNDLRPAILDLGLTSAIRELIERTYAGAVPLRVHLDICGQERRLTDECEFALYRIAQESLSNVVKHARATEATVTVRFDAASVEVCVQDNGRGFVVPARLEEIAGDHLGLIGMRERLATLGGTLAVTSQPGQGTLVCACVPG